MQHDGTLQEARAIKESIRHWGRELGFSALGFAPVQLPDAAARLAAWLDKGYHGSMDYMARHQDLRTRPEALLPGTRAVICARLDYPAGNAAVAHPWRAEISRYALGRDYHKTMRQGLQRLATRIEREIGPCIQRAFADSAPVPEVELARLAGLGWRGKHTLLLGREGSWFFLGELYTSLPLPPDTPASAHCGRCRACLDVCPTGAIVAPYELDARRCISYLTIEHPGPIPLELRPLLGNRIYGCDDCQSACPWNRHARSAGHPDFLPRHGLDQARLPELFAWDAATFDDRLAGSPIRRIGHERWLRNLAVALGNAPAHPALRTALASRLEHPSALVREHVAWALERQGNPPGRSPPTPNAP